MEHRQWLRSVAFSPDGRLIASAAGAHPFYVGGQNPRIPGEMKLWDAQTGRLIAGLGRHGDSIDRVVFNRDGTRPASIGYDGTIQLFDPATVRTVGELRHAFFPVGRPDTQSGTQGVAVLADSLTVVGFAYTKAPGLRLFDLATGAARRVSARPPPRRSGPSRPTDSGRSAISRGRSRSGTRPRARLLASWDDAGDDIELSPDGRLVTGRAEGGRTMAVYEMASGRVLCRYTSAGREARFAHDSRKLINWNSKFAVRVDVAGGGTTIVPLSGASFLNGVAVSADGRSLGVAYSDQTVRIYDLTTGLESRIYRGHTFGVACLAFAPDGSRLVSGGQDGAVKVWDLRQPQQGLHIGETGTILGGEWMSSLGFRDGGRQIVGVRHLDDASVSVVDIATNRKVAQQRLELSREFEVPRFDTALSGDGERLAGPGPDRLDARVWDVESGRELLRTTTQPGPLRGLALNQDARWMATAAAPPEGRTAGEVPLADVTIWDLRQGTVVASATIRTPAPSCMAFNAGADRLAFGGADGRVRVWRPGSGDAPRVLPGASDTLTCVAFSPDGRRLAATEKTSGIVRVWDSSSEAPLFHDGDRPGLQGPRSLTWVTFSPDGRRIGAIGYDGVAFLWDARTGQELLTLQTIGGKRLGDFAYNARLIFSPDGRRLAANHWRFGATVWDAD